MLIKYFSFFRMDILSKKPAGQLDDEGPSSNPPGSHLPKASTLQI